MKKNSNLEQKKASPKKFVNNKSDLLFQVSDWDYYHENVSNGDETLSKYIIRIYGTTPDGKKVFVKVKDYTPYFYVKIPKSWSRQRAQLLMETVKNEVEKTKPELVSSLKEWDIVDKHSLWEFSNYELFSFIRLIFHGYDGFRAYERIFNRAIRDMRINPKPVKYQLFESNMEPLLRCMHIKKLNSVGWIKLPANKYHIFPANENPSTNDICVYTDWTNLTHVEDTNILPFTIAAFDIECTSGDGTFPQPHRDEDKVIQIGTTFSKYGEGECYYKHITTLGSCDKIQGADVEPYDNEVAVLLAWTRMMRRTNPDIVTGYNIYGFDFKYLAERAKKLGCYTSFSKLGRIQNEVSPFIEKKLESSALGKNELYYYMMQGRVTVDLMKVLQRDYKLGSYKLDNVASEFIRELIMSVEIDVDNNTTTIKTESTYGLEVGRYVKVYFNDGLSDNTYKNEAKFKVIGLTPTTLTIQGILDGEALELKKYKVYWCQAKDDVSPHDIFRLQKGTSADRAIVATYCISEGTPVMTINENIPIENFNNINDNVLSWNENKKGLQYSKQSKFFNNGEKECVELTLEDGTKLICTDDHKILTSENKWIEARNLQLNKDKMRKSFTFPISNIQKDIDMYKEWNFNQYNLKNETEYYKAMAYVRLLGYVLADGTIQKYRSTVYVGASIDIDNIKNDIRLICNNENVNIKIHKGENAFYFDLPRSISKGYLTIPGITMGKRTSQKSSFPDFIMDNKCPLPILKEFLGGFFGGDGHTPCYRNKSKDFSCVAISQTKDINNIDNLKLFMKNISDILSKFNIQSSIHNPTPKKLSGDIQKFSITLQIAKHDMIKFEENIGFRYCIHKSIRLAVASSYEKIKENIFRQSNWIVNKVIELKENYKYKDAILEAHNQLRKSEVIYNNYYSLPKYNTVVRRIANNKIAINEIPMKHKYFADAKDYLKSIDGENFFKNENCTDNTKFYAIKKDDTVIPIYNLKIIDRRNVGMRKVYDMEINDNHSYVANGIIVHNCLQDSSLCNKLMNKLQVLTNNISMASVCSVPLSYIFLRGQGVKIFSLVGRICREKNHVIPVIKKPFKPKDTDPKPKFKKRYDDDDDKKDENDKEGYEGATVFKPTVGIHYEPISVLDYNSLYPNCMRFRNISHDCIVKDSKYDNLPGYYYSNVTYANKDGTTTTCRYAKAKDGRKGIICDTLTELLDTRIKIKDLMENEKDPFKKKILNGLQNAYKVTANSLYGQCGAPTSPIYMKDIAASTTATGREMLNAARIFAEMIFPILIDAISFKSFEDFEEKIEILFQKDVDKILGEENVKKLQTIVEGEEYARYGYLRIFKENKDLINDKKFANDYLKHTCKQDFIQWVYDTIRTVLPTHKIDPHVIYGDSVTGKTPILLRQNKEIKIMTIEQIGTQWKDYDQFKSDDATLTNKKQDDNINLEVWTDQGWSKIKRVIKHNTKKEIYRVCTHTGVVDVTEDHSLLSETCELIKPETCVVGETKLLHKFPEIIDNNIDTMSDDKAYIYGFFMGDGSSGSYDTKYGIKYQWYLCNKDLDLMKELQTKCQNIYPDYDFKILDTLKSSNVYKLVPSRKIKPFVEEYRKAFYDNNKYKIIPNNILNSSKKVRESFLKGYYAADGCRKDTENIGCHRFDIKGQISAMNMYYLVKSLGYKASISTRSDKMDIYRISYTTKAQRKNAYTVKKIYKLGTTTDYVYDLETDVGHFHAGVGELIVKNTDSIFIKFGIVNTETNEMLTDHESLKISIELGKMCGAILHKILPVPQNMLYEKTFHPFVILTKKRYVGNKYEFNPNKYYQDAMGITLKRRDNAPIVKIVVGGIVKCILNDRSSEKAMAFTKKTLRDILSNKYQMDKFIVSKSIKGNALTVSERIIEAKKPKDQRTYADRTRIVQAVLADRMAERDPGNKPQSNDRIPYAYIINDNAKLQGDRVEHPDYIVENNLPLDYLFYITNQIMKPSLQFLQHIDEKAKSIFETCIMKELNRRTGKRPLSYYFGMVNDDDPFGDVEDEDNDDDEIDDDKNNMKQFSCHNELTRQEDEIVVNPKKKITKKKIKQVHAVSTVFDKKNNGFLLSD